MHAAAADAAALLEQPPDVLGQPGQLVDPGVQYYLRHVMPHGVPVPRELFVSKTSPQSN